MDRKQREQFRDIVLAAMEAKAWSAATVAKEAKVSQTTMTKITRAENVTPGTVGKVRRALGIQALARAQAKEGYTIDVELIRDAIGMWLRDVPETGRAAKVAHLFAAIATGTRTHGDTPEE